MKKKPVDQGEETRKLRILFTLLAALLVMLGQIILYTTPTDTGLVLPGSLWLCAAGVVLLVAANVVRPPRFLLSLAPRLRVPRTVVCILVAVVLSLLAVYSAFLYVRAGRFNFISVVALWLAAGTCYVAGFSQGIFAGIRWRDWLRSHRAELIALGVVVLAGIVVRFSRLGEIPRVINGDEGKLGLTAETTILGPLSNPFALWDNMGALYLQAINLVFKFFGQSAFSLRLLSAIGGVLAIPALYLFARQLAGRRVALISAILLAFSHTHINFSRTAGADYLHSTWLLPLILYFLFSGLERRRLWRTALAGVLLSIFATVFQTGQIAVGVAFVYLLVLLAIDRAGRRENLRHLLTFWGGFLITALPEGFYIWRYPNEFLARLGASGTFQTGWLAQTMAATGHSAFSVLSERVVHAFLSLIFYPALDFYGSPTPMLTLVAASLFLIGLGLSFWRTRGPGYLMLNGYFWGFTLAIGIFAIPPSADSVRMLNVLPAALLMAGLALDQVLEMVGLGWQRSRAGYAFVVGITLFSLIFTNLWTYFGDFAGRCLYADNLQGRFASYLGSYATTIPPEDTIYLLSNDVYFYGSHPSTDFLSGSRTITNFKAPTDELPVEAGEIIVANPERFDELRAWASTHPGGQLHYVYDCSSVILVVYRFP